MKIFFAMKLISYNLKILEKFSFKINRETDLQNQSANNPTRLHKALRTQKQAALGKSIIDLKRRK